MTDRLVIVVDNIVRHRRGTRAEWGFSAHVCAGGKSCLFDTGASGLVLENAGLLGVDLAGTDCIALSHGHFDHTGGLHALLQVVREGTPLYAHPSALEPKYTGSPGGPATDVGFACERDELEGHLRLVKHEGPIELWPGVSLTGTVPRCHPLEDTGLASYLDEAMTSPDPVLDDQSLVIDGADGLTVLFGCCHSGVINTLEHVRNLMPGRPIRCIIGGTHLIGASDERLEATVDYLRALAVDRVIAAHCTEWGAMVRLSQGGSYHFMPSHVGLELSV